jgi:uncharacterized membrane protein YphA (DoxX/SURF4 family)
MNVALWSAQILLAAVFLASGIAKSTMSRERLLETGQTGVAVFPQPVVRFAASMEVAGAVGLVVPWWSGIAPGLTPAAAFGLAIVMIGAGSAHVRLHEPRNVAVNALLLALCLFVAIGRLPG